MTYNAATDDKTGDVREIRMRKEPEKAKEKLDVAIQIGENSPYWHLPSPKST